MRAFILVGSVVTVALGVFRAVEGGTVAGVILVGLGVVMFARAATSRRSARVATGPSPLAVRALAVVFVGPGIVAFVLGLAGLAGLAPLTAAGVVLFLTTGVVGTALGLYIVRAVRRG